MHHPFDLAREATLRLTLGALLLAVALAAGHLPTVWRITRQRLATSLLSTPCAHARMMRARSEAP